MTSATSAICFWGLFRALKKRVPGAWLFFWLILLYPAVYYITFPNFRYRQPLEPFIVILGISLIAGKVRRASVQTIPDRSHNAAA